MERVYNQINCESTIKEKTGGYSPGKIYLYKEKNKKPKQIKRWNGIEFRNRRGKECSVSVYDIESGNFHIVPVEYEEINEKIVDAREMIHSKINPSNNKGSRGVSNCPLAIEKYILVEKDGYDYILCFERLYTTGKSVNSALGLFQFYKYPKNSSVNLSKEGFKMCYPDTYEDGEGKTVGKDRVVYNPKDLPTIYELNEDNVDNVCEEFKKFIENN